MRYTWQMSYFVSFAQIAAYCEIHINGEGWYQRGNEQWLVLKDGKYYTVTYWRDVDVNGRTGHQQVYDIGSLPVHVAVSKPPVFE